MPERLDVAVVGAGPFGLSIAAWLDDRAVRVYGPPLRTWRTLMPPDMLLRSAWEETSLSARGGRGSIGEWAAATGEQRQEPIPLPLFLRYADWFRGRYVHDHDPNEVEAVERSGERFRIRTVAGAEAEAAEVVVAVGATPFAYAPPALADAVGEHVSFSISATEFERFEGRRVVVVGAGQSGLESAALAAGAGAEVELLARSGVRWFADHEPHHARGRAHAALYRFAYPVVGYGPPPLNRLAAHPDLFACAPWAVRRRLTARMLRPGGSPWIRAAVEGRVRITQGVTVTGIETNGDRVRLALSDGDVREAEHVLLATGYRFRLDRLPWLAPELAERIETVRGWPVLDRAFRSTVPGIRFAGYAAEGRFGPLSRFVLGTEFTAARIART